MTLSLRKVLMLLIVSAGLALTGCTSGSKKASSGDSMVAGVDGSSMEGMALEVNGDSDNAKAGGLRTVNFGYNSARLSASTKAVLEANAQFLKDNPSVEVTIEGHCDERGGVQFNIALGEKRARATKNYLASLGVESSRMNTISYGKERGIAFGHDEESWSQNRRANFVVTAK